MLKSTAQKIIHNTMVTFTNNTNNFNVNLSQANIKMTEDLKSIVNEVNKNLNTEYNLISFDSLSPEGLQQIVINALAANNACPQFEVRGNDPEEIGRRIMEGLRNIQYRPTGHEQMDPSLFRTALNNGEKRTIYPILIWIFQNKDKVQQTAYLAKYLSFSCYQYN